MAGKSTHLTMVGSLTVLAHLGSYVPAAECCIPLRQRVVLRAGAVGAGGLFAEAGQLAAALEAADERALVLLDEVGYATGTADGLALGWAVAEALLERGALSLLATHLLELRRVAQVYATATHAALEVCWRTGCTLQHTLVTMMGNQVVVDRGRVACSWRVANAGQQAAHYGLALARDMALPDDVMATAAKVVALLGDAEEPTENPTSASGVAQRAEALQLAHKVRVRACIVVVLHGALVLNR